MNIIRKYKIHLLNKETLIKKEVDDLNNIFEIVKYSKENYDLIDFIYNNFFNLKELKLKEYSNIIFYLNKDDKFVFENDLNVEWFFVRDNLIWSILENKFNYKKYEIIDLIKDIFEDIYKIDKIKPIKLTITSPNIIEELYINEYNKTI